MKRGDKYYRIRPLSDRMQHVKLIDEFPDLEYLLRAMDLETGKTLFINKTILELKWKSFKGGLQTRMFTVDKTEYYRKLLKKP